MKKIFNNSNAFVFAFLLLTTFLIVMFCSRSSFLYPFNNWDDANSFFTMGKSMFDGKVIYKDVYDQKGILLYFIYGLASRVSYTSFTGVFLLEILFACVYEFLIYKILKLYMRWEAALLLSPVPVILGFTSLPFYFGGSAEEFCLPFIAAPMYFMLNYIKGERKERMPWWHVFLSGCSAGCVFWIKYTITGVFFAFAIFAVIAYIMRKDFIGLLEDIGVFIGGIAAVSLPWFIYFAANNAFEDFYIGYIYNNMFRYSYDYGMREKLFKVVRVFFERVIVQGAIFAIPAIVGVLFVFFKGIRRPSLENFYVPFAFACMHFFIYIGGMVGVYYCLPLSFFSLFGVVAVKELFSYIYSRTEVMQKVKIPLAFLGAAACMASPLLSWAFTPNRSFIGYDKDELFMYEFKTFIEEKRDSEILNYGTLDLGVYTVTGKSPVCKYFCGLNLLEEEIREEQDDIVKNKLVDFVICEFDAPQVIKDNYELLAESHKKFDDSENLVYLYGLKNRGPAS